MDFISKIIAERRAARMPAPPPPMDYSPEPPAQAEAEAEYSAQPEPAEDAFAPAADLADAQEPPMVLHSPKTFVAPAWTNPNAADIPPSLLVPEEEIDLIGHRFVPEAELPDPLHTSQAPATAPEGAPAAAARPIQTAPFGGWDRAQPLGRSPAMADVTRPAFAAPAAAASVFSAPAPALFASDPAPQVLTPAVAAFSGRPLAPAAADVRVAAPASAPQPAPQPESQPDLDEMPYVSARPGRRATGILNDAGVQMPPPAAGRGTSRSGHVKTRMLGFNPESLGVADPFESQGKKPESAFPVGWIVVVGGPGLGSSFVLHDGVARVGRGEDQEICLNFGDNAISRENHVSLAFDAEQNAFYVGQSGRGNIVRLNNKPLLSTEQLRSGDQIRIGETTLRFAALCGEDFAWARPD